MITFLKNIFLIISDFFAHIAFSLSSKKEKDAEVEVSMGEVVTPPPHFHVDRFNHPSPKKKRGRPPKKRST
jgi:hypothetical protein